jgi:hypothetical protein
MFLGLDQTQQQLIGLSLLKYFGFESMYFYNFALF